jgi:hypothetical protein
VRRIQGIRVDGAVVGFTAGLVVLSGVLFGLLPALSAARPGLMGALRSGGRETGRTGGTIRNGLVVAELAFAVVLLVGAGLLLRSFLLMQQVDLGFRDRGVVMVSIGFPAPGIPMGMPPSVRSTTSSPDSVPTRPFGAAEVTDLPPLSGGDQDVTAIPVGEPRRPEAPEGIWYRSVSAGYLPVMQMRLVAGRNFTPEDRQGSMQVGIVNEEAARRFWPGKSPIGRILAQGEDSTAPRLTIVGVVASARHDGPNQPLKTELFAPFEQFPSRGPVFILEPARDQDAAVAAFRQVSRKSIPGPGRECGSDRKTGGRCAFPAASLRAVDRHLRERGAAARGPRGVRSDGLRVAQRQREIGVRLALGAAPSSIRRLVLGQGARLALLGTGSD